MVTPLIELLNLVISNRGEFSEAFLQEHGYADIDGADMQEAMLAFADSLPVAQSARLMEIADNLDIDEALGLDGAAAALNEAQAAYESILEAEGVERTDADDDLDLDLDLDIEDSADSSVAVSVSVSGDDDPDIDVDITGDDDPSVDIVVNGDEVELDDLDTDTDFLGDLAETDQPVTGEDDGLELDFD